MNSKKLFKNIYSSWYVWLLIVSIFLVLIAGFVNLERILVERHLDLLTFVYSQFVPQINANQLREQPLKSIMIIDLRSQKEYKQEHIPDSISIPLKDIESGVGVEKILSIAQNQPKIVLYCQAGGNISFKTYKLLKKTGLSFVVLTGGFKNWKQSTLASKD